MRIPIIGEGVRVTVTTTRSGTIKRVLLGDIEVPLDYLTDVHIKFEPYGTTVYGSFEGPAIIIEADSDDSGMNLQYPLDK